MKMKLTVAALMLMLSSAALAADWLAPFLGGVILGNIYNEHQHRQRQQVGPPAFVFPTQTVYIDNDPYGVPRNPYQPACRVEDIFDRQGRYLGRQQICN
jgi:opacity protein-like surface antigen